MTTQLAIGRTERKVCPSPGAGIVTSATDGERRWWLLPANLNDVTKEAIALAVPRGWMLDRGDGGWDDSTVVDKAGVRQHALGGLG